MVSFVNKVLFLVLLVGLVAKTSCAPAPAPTANRDLCVRLPSLTLCTPILQIGVLKGSPPAGCCADLRILQLANIIFGRNNTCLCVRQTLSAVLGGIVRSPTPSPSPSPRAGIRFEASDVAVNISAQIQIACGVNLGFSLDANSSC